MGFKINLFMDEPSRDVICPVCFGVFDDPVEDECGHRFCFDCLSPWFHKTGRCPISNQSIQGFSSNEDLAHRINALKIKCVECKKSYIPVSQRVEGCTECSVRRIANRTAAEASFDRQYNRPQQFSYQKYQGKQEKQEDNFQSPLNWTLITGVVATAAIILLKTSKKESKSNLQKIDGKSSDKTNN